MISIVTPCLNQAAWLEEAIRSVLGQNHPGLEYVIIDGGSTDGSVEIIRRHAHRLAAWESGPDGGQYAAINKGFARTRGEIMGWLNADDKQTPWALAVVDEIFAYFPEIEWLTALCPLEWDQRGRAVRCLHRAGYHRDKFLRGDNLPSPRRPEAAWIQQESTFWRRSLWERAGGQVGDGFPLAGDFELWGRFFRADAELHAVETPLAGFRFHAAQRTADHAEAYLREAERAFAKHGGRVDPPGHALRSWATRALPAAAARLGWLVPCPIVRYSRRTAQWTVRTVLS